jgi:hypothetical protein
MMKLATLAFLLLLLGAHLADDSDELVGQPLSMFRDGPQAGWGYALFAVLVLIGVLHTVALVRARREVETLAAGVAAVLLLVVAVTPSWGPFHIFCSLVLLLLLYCYFGLLLHLAGSLWVCAHLPVPFALVCATGVHSYGLWQKALIVYFVVLTAIRHHLLALPPVRLAWATSGARSARGRRVGKRHKVYELTPSREWARRGPARG